MCLAQGPQRRDAGEAQTRGPSVYIYSHFLFSLEFFLCLSYKKLFKQIENLT